LPEAQSLWRMRERLNHLAVMHVGLHQDHLDLVNPTAIAKEFVNKSDGRQLVFGD